MRSAIVAGLVAGLLGGAVSGLASAVVVWHMTRHDTPPATEPTPTSEAERATKAVVETLLSKLKAGDLDGFASAARERMVGIDEPRFQQLRTHLVESRKQYQADYGNPTGEFELLSQQSASPSLVRLVYLEKFEKGGVVWYFFLYRAKDGWRISTVFWDLPLPPLFGPVR